MDPLAVVGDSQDGGGALAQLVAAMGSPYSNGSNGLAGLAGASQQDGIQEVQEQVQQEGAGPSGGGGGSTPTAAHPPITAAAAAFAAWCAQQGVDPHPQLLRGLSQLSDEAFMPAIPGSRSGKGELGKGVFVLRHMPALQRVRKLIGWHCEGGRLLAWCSYSYRQADTAMLPAVQSSATAFNAQQLQLNCSWD